MKMRNDTWRKLGGRKQLQAVGGGGGLTLIDRMVGTLLQRFLLLHFARKLILTYPHSEK
jgi:hypothetical protein